MNSTSYTDNEIFANPQINAIIDLLFQKLEIQFPAGDSDRNNNFLFQGLILSGKAANILQGATDEPVNNIVFETFNIDIYDYFIRFIDEDFPNSNSIKFKDRILFYPYGHFFEIWFAKTTLSPVSTNGIYIQSKNNIPEETL